LKSATISRAVVREWKSGLASFSNWRVRNQPCGIGSEIAEAAAASGDGPRVRMLAVRNIPKSGRTADDVLAYVHLSVAEIVQAAKTLTRQRGPARS
jgi:hypothetical protein